MAEKLEAFLCQVCGEVADIEVTWPDGWSVRVCQRDAPKSESPDLTFVSLWEQWRKELDR